LGEQLAEGGDAGPRADQEPVAGAPLGPVQQEGRHVADVDELERAAGVARRDEPAAAPYPVQPGGQPPDVLVRAEDHAGREDQLLTGEPALDGALAARLERLVGPLAGARVRRALVQRR